jgi:purine-binding chemotaxis protein CheW
MSEGYRESKADQLRADFDRAFAQAHAAVAPAQLDLLLIRIGGHPYALPLSQILALHTDRALTEAPSPRRELLGLVGLRGVVTPVCDLGALLGYEAGQSTRFLVQVDAPSPFALAFEHFERHVRRPATDLLPVAGDAAGGAVPTSGTLTLASGPVTVLDLRALFEQWMHGGRPASAPKPVQERQ